MAHGSVVEMSRLARLSSLLFVLVLALTSAACFVPHYQVISKSGPPSALVGLGPVWVQYDYSHVAISDKRMTEEQWLASREKDEHRKTYLETKDSANMGFVEGLAGGLAGVQINPGPAPAGAIQITVSYIDWDEGMYAGVVAWPSKAAARVIFTRDGQTLDEIEVRTAENASVFTPAAQQRFHTCGQRLGQYAAEYVHAVQK
jgi:hypothetical protein